jgi:hypothetical protein
LIDVLVPPLATCGKEEHGKMKSELRKMICAVRLGPLRAMQSLVNIKNLSGLSLIFDVGDANSSTYKPSLVALARAAGQRRATPINM